MPGFEGNKTFSRFEDVIVCTGCLVGSRSLGRDRQCRDRCEVIKAAEPSTPRASREGSKARETAEGEGFWNQLRRRLPIPYCRHSGWKSQRRDVKREAAVGWGEREVAVAGLALVWPACGLCGGGAGARWRPSWHSADASASEVLERTEKSFTVLFAWFECLKVESPFFSEALSG